METGFTAMFTDWAPENEYSAAKERTLLFAVVDVDVELEPATNSPYKVLRNSKTGRRQLAGNVAKSRYEKIFRASLLLFVLSAGLISIAAESFNFPASGRFILPPSLGKELFHQCSRPVPTGITEYRQPSAKSRSLRFLSRSIGSSGKKRGNHVRLRMRLITANMLVL